MSRLRVQRSHEPAPRRYASPDVRRLSQHQRLDTGDRLDAPLVLPRRRPRCGCLWQLSRRDAPGLRGCPDGLRWLPSARLPGEPVSRSQHVSEDLPELPQHHKLEQRNRGRPPRESLSNHYGAAFRRRCVRGLSCRVAWLTDEGRELRLRSLSPGRSQRAVHRQRPGARCAQGLIHALCHGRAERVPRLPSGGLTGGPNPTSPHESREDFSDPADPTDHPTSIIPPDGRFHSRRLAEVW